ncbi:MAG: hypothetical protein FJ109_18020 [Deltaproteobacteria bacterium]|nr:hypothetical protein [Deltaproteobacteria bacterium]
MTRWILTAVLLASCSGNGRGPEDAGLPDARPDPDARNGDAPTDWGADDERTADVPSEAAGLEEMSPPDCAEGTQQCEDEKTALLCQNGHWVTTQVCSGEMICLSGACVPSEPCEPGSIAGCFSLSSRKLCHVSGKGYTALPCPEGEKCADGSCGQFQCNPGVRQCQGPTAFTECLADGSGWGPEVACADGETCIGGKCLSGCAGDIKYNQSNVGCEFWSVDLGQWHVKEGESNLEPSASTIPHAVVVGNPNDVAAKVTFEVGDGTPVTVPDPIVPPGEARAFIMPELSLQESGITKRSIRLRTNHPVTAAQFNPPTNEDFVHTSDASLLYPTTILGKEHYVVSMPSKIGAVMPMIGKMPSVWGYAVIIAVEPGTTTVSMVLTAATEPGPDFPGYGKGSTIDVELEQWDVLTVNSLANSLMAAEIDMTGSHIVASQKVAVFGGHQCWVVGNSNCDHLETQLLPVEEWGLTYVAGRMNTLSPNEYRVVSGDNANVIHTTPAVGGVDGLTLNKGEWKHFAGNSSFEITGTGPIQVIQFIAGNSEGGSVLVDPSMTTLIPVHQFRSDYPILVPTAYDANFVNIVRKGGTPIKVNGQPVTAGFELVGGTDWQVANVPVPEGIVQVQADAQFGLISYGYANKVSYAYPGGLNGKVEE